MSAAFTRKPGHMADPRGRETLVATVDNEKFAEIFPVEAGYEAFHFPDGEFIGAGATSPEIKAVVEKHLRNLLDAA
jgi:hypothetical protein